MSEELKMLETFANAIPKINVNLDISKKKISNTTVKPCESKSFEVKITNKKKKFLRRSEKIQLFVACCGDGNFRVRELRHIEEKLDSYEQMYKNEKINQEEYNRLRDKAISDEMKGICED